MSTMSDTRIGAGTPPEGDCDGVAVSPGVHDRDETTERHREADHLDAPADPHECAVGVEPALVLQHVEHGAVEP